MKFFINKKAMTLVELIISITLWAIVLIISVTFISNMLKTTVDSEEKNKIVEEWFTSYSEFNKKIQSGFFWTWIIDYDEWVWYDVLLMINKDKTKWFLWWVVDVKNMKLDQPSDYNIYKNKVFWYALLSKSQINDILTDHIKVYDCIFYKDKLYTSLFVKDFQVENYNSGSIMDINFSIWMWYNSDYDWQKISDLINKNYLMKFNLNF